ncbi:MAG TPA: hypothetical protein VMU38_08670 [Candidatus Binatia bacterium]|nr:hypothetical protein [Candidatus Binatia bacterium]
MAGKEPQRRDWGESAALLAGLALYVGLQNRYIFGGTVLNLALGVSLAIMCALSIFWTIAGDRKLARTITTIAAVVFGLNILASTVQVVRMIVNHGESIDGARLIETALFIWVSNIIMFAVVYRWSEQEFAFPTCKGTATPIAFLDCVYLSFTTSTAFSATDAPPLTTRARMYTIIEAAISLMTISVVAARAVNILK